MSQGPFDFVDALILSGSQISGQDAESLESALVREPHDITARTKLLGYYFQWFLSDPEASAARDRHVLWLIANLPEADVLRFPPAHLYFASTHTNAYSAGRQEWIRQLLAHPRNLKVLENAAHCFLQRDAELAIEILLAAVAFDPENSQWHGMMARVHSHRLRRTPPKDIPDVAATALSSLEKEFALAPDYAQEFLLDELAKTALASNDIAKARDYAEMAVNQNVESYNYGNNIHHGNLILGRIAIRVGDFGEAKARLLSAGQTPGSSQLDSFGPNMTLAKELLEHGESDAVLSYFKLCSNFWTSPHNQLQQWTAVVAQGGIPDFGANLRY